MFVSTKICQEYGQKIIFAYITITVKVTIAWIFISAWFILLYSLIEIFKEE